MVFYALPYSEMSSRYRCRVHIPKSSPAYGDILAPEHCIMCILFDLSSTINDLSTSHNPQGIFKGKVFKNPPGILDSQNSSHKLELGMEKEQGSEGRCQMDRIARCQFLRC